MKAGPSLLFAACLSLAGVHGQLNPQFKYDVCRKEYLNLAATGDRKSPACWIFARTENEETAYEAFSKEISSRQFSFKGARDRILNRLQVLAPPSLELGAHKAALSDKGLEDPSLPEEFKRKFLDVIAFLCCLTRQASDVKWSDRQIKRWDDLGLNVAEELAKKDFETPAPAGPAPKVAKPSKEKKAPKAPAPEPGPPEAPAEQAPSEVSLGLGEAHLTLPSGARAVLQFNPKSNALLLQLPKPINQCSLQDIQDALVKQQDTIESMILKSSKTSELEEARNVGKWKLTAITIDGNIPEITNNATAGRVIRFSITAEVPKPKEEEAEAPVPIPTTPEAAPTQRAAPEEKEPTEPEQKAPPPEAAPEETAAEKKEPTEQEQKAPPPEAAPEETAAEKKEPTGPEQKAPPPEAAPEETAAEKKEPTEPEQKAPPPEAAPEETAAEKKEPTEQEQKAPPPEPAPEKAPVEEQKPQEQEPEPSPPKALPRKASVQDCEQFPLTLDIAAKDIRQQTLTRLVTFLNSTALKSDSVRVGAVCLTWAANTEIYERLNMAVSRKWKATEVIDGAPTASHWIALKLQTAIDTKDIKGTKETNKEVIHNSRICIDAVRVMGRLMSQKRQDKPDAQIAGPASILATAMNLSMDIGEMLPVHAIFMSVISWYHEAVNCLVQTKQEPRHILAYVALPGKDQILSFLSFVEKYNGVITKIKPEASKAKSTLERAAKMCDIISLATEGTRLPQSLGGIDLQLEEELRAIVELVKGS